MIFLLLRFALAAVFGVAGVSKLADRQGTQKAISAFGLPNFLARPLSILLPGAELMIAFLLLPIASAYVAAVGALVLLVGFSIGVGLNLAIGRKPDCHCFGQLHSKPIGWPTLARNAVFASLAGLVIWGGPGATITQLAAWLTELSGREVIVLSFATIVSTALLVQTWLMFHVIRQHGRLWLRLDDLEKAQNDQYKRPPTAPVTQPAAMGLTLGTFAPSFTLPTLSGELMTLDHLREGDKPVVLIFSDPDCGPCTALIPEVVRWQADHGDTIRIAVVSRGSKKAHRRNAEQYVSVNVLLQTDREVAHTYQAHGTPAAVLIRSDGRIGSHVVMGSSAINELIGTATGRLPSLPSFAQSNERAGKAAAQSTKSQALRIGEAAPPIRLPDLQGRTVALDDFKGRSTLVLFWNPACSFCQRILGQLKAWEWHHPRTAPQLVVIATGTADANRAMGLESPVLLDQTFGVARQFGASGTPSAVLIDADGKVASEMAVGAPAIFQLVDWRTTEPAPVKHAPRAVTVQ
jgi:peroxiredoxin